MKKLLKVMAAVAVIAVIACVLVACVPSNMDKAKSKMEDAGYTVIGSTTFFEGLEGAFNANKLGGGYVWALYFKDKDSAKAVYDKLLGENKDKKDSIVKQKGKWVYTGTEQGIKDFEK